VIRASAACYCCVLLLHVIVALDCCLLLLYDIATSVSTHSEREIYSLYAANQVKITFYHFEEVGYFHSVSLTTCKGAEVTASRSFLNKKCFRDEEWVFRIRGIPMQFQEFKVPKIVFSR
jgi:hypothetical protein